MNISNVLAGICSLLFFMVGLDKFLNFLEPPCSLMDSIPLIVWKIFGVMQIAAGILIWMKKFRKPVALFFFLFMTVFTIIHLVNNTSDVGGSVFMAMVLSILVWNPPFIRGKQA